MHGSVVLWQMRFIGSGRPQQRIGRSLIAPRFFRVFIRGYLFWPLSMVVAAIFLASITARSDGYWASQSELSDFVSVLRLNAEGARAVLSTVATAAATILSLVYSMTLVVFTLAASSLGNRIIRTFGDNRLGQITAGLLAGTFVFALSTLYLSPTDSPPLISAAVAVALAILSVILLIIFVNNVAHRIQIDNELARIQRMLTASINGMTHQLTGKTNQANHTEDNATVDDLPGTHAPWVAPATGYITALDLERLITLMCQSNTTMIMRVQAGDFVLQGEELASVYSSKEQGSPLSLLNAKAGRFVSIGDARAPESDVQFNVHLMVEIALRALSPGVNDSYTAIAALDQLSASLVVLMRSPTLEARLRDKQGTIRVTANMISVKELLGAAVHPIRRAAAGNVLVMIALAKVLDRLARHSSASHGALLRRHIILVVSQTRGQDHESADRKELADLLLTAWRATKRLPR